MLTCTQETKLRMKKGSTLVMWSTTQSEDCFIKLSTALTERMIQMES